MLLEIFERDGVIFVGKHSRDVGYFAVEEGKIAHFVGYELSVNEERREVGTLSCLLVLATLHIKYKIIRMVIISAQIMSRWPYRTQ